MYPVHGGDQHFLRLAHSGLRATQIQEDLGRLKAPIKSYTRSSEETRR